MKSLFSALRWLVPGGADKLLPGTNREYVKIIKLVIGVCFMGRLVAFKTFKWFLLLFGAFILGGVFVFALQIFFAALPAPGEPISADLKEPNEFYETAKVKPGYILPHENWVLNYNVSFALVDSVALTEDNMCTTLRTYGLVLLKRKEGSPAKELPSSSSYFWIAGLKTVEGKSEFVGFRILPSNLTKDSETMLFKVVSFPAGFFKSRAIKIASELELRSDDPSKYDEWFRQR